MNIKFATLTYNLRFAVVSNEERDVNREGLVYG